jgi:hypothetical protein
MLLHCEILMIDSRIEDQLVLVVLMFLLTSATLTSPRSPAKSPIIRGSSAGAQIRRGIEGEEAYFRSRYDSGSATVAYFYIG